MMRSWTAAAAFALLAGAGLGIAEEDFDPQPIIEGRQAGLRDIGAAFKGIGDELKGAAPSVASIRHHAKQIEDMTKQQKFWFPPGTGPEAEIETQAKAEIWQSPEEFKAGQNAFTQEAQKLSGVAEGGDVAAIRAQWRELGKTCKACHDKFREEED